MSKLVGTNGFRQHTILNQGRLQRKINIPQTQVLTLQKINEDISPKGFVTQLVYVSFLLCVGYKS